MVLRKILVGRHGLGSQELFNSHVSSVEYLSIEKLNVSFLSRFFNAGLD